MRFKYNDRVSISCGFYRGSYGRVVGYEVIALAEEVKESNIRNYTVELDDGKVIQVGPSYLILEN